MNDLDSQSDEMTPTQWALVAFGVLTLLGIALMVVKLSGISVGVFAAGVLGSAAMTFHHWKANVFGAAERANQWVAGIVVDRAEAKAATKPSRKVHNESGPQTPTYPIDPETGDRIYWTGRPSIFRMRPFYTLVTLACTAIGVGFLLAAALDTEGRVWKLAVGFGCLLIAGVDWFRAMLTVWSARYTIFGKRAWMRIGLFSKNTIETRHKDVRSVEVDQSILQRVFGCGTVRISSAAGPGEEVVFFGIAHPQAVAGLLRRLQDAT